MSRTKIIKVTKDMGLKTCPFCGGKNLIIMVRENIHLSDESVGHQVFCHTCGGATGIGELDDVIDRWNTRIPDGDKDGIY